MPGPISDLIDPVRLTPYLEANVAGFRGPFTCKKTDVGQSNPTFILSAVSGKYVLRRKPPGALLKSAHAVEREFRVITALADTSVPVPRTLHLCEDEMILGKPFFVMEFIDGQTFNDPACPDLSAEARRQLYLNMNKTLAAIHNIDLVKCGLVDFGRPGNYFERQISRWSRQYRLSQTEDICALDTLIDWLTAHVPADDDVCTLVHGDYRLDNLLVHPKTGAVLGVLDWELSTLGHPLADLGAQLMQWSLPNTAEGRGLAGVKRRDLGIPEDQEYIELYAKNAGLTDVPDMTFSIAFNFFRMAAILQGVKKRAMDGNASSPEKALQLGRYIPQMADNAWRLINGES